MPLIYATVDDLAAWTDTTPPGDADVLLREASTLVQAACLADLYDTDPDGYPTDATLRDAMRDATCAQVVFWAVHGIDPTAGAAGLDAVVTSSGIDGASVSTNAADLAESKTASLGGVVPTASRILRFAGLASNWVRSW